MVRKPRNRAERSRRFNITVCILASIVFWLSIKLSATYSTLEPIELDYRLPSGLAFAQDPPRVLEANVSATGWELLAQNFRQRDRRILIDSLDMRANPDGIISIRRAVAEAFNAEGLRVNAMTNERVVVRTEQVAYKSVPLQLVADLHYAPGFSNARAPLLTPDSVVVSGPASVLETIDFWPSDTVKARGVQGELKVVGLVAQPTTTSLRVQPSQFEMQLTAEQFTEKRVYVPVKVLGLNAKDSVTLFPRQVLVSCAVGLSDYESVTPSDFELEVNLEGVPLDKQIEVPVLVVESPEEVTRVRVTPRKVEVYVRAKQK